MGLCVKKDQNAPVQYINKTIKTLLAEFQEQIFLILYFS